MFQAVLAIVAAGAALFPAAVKSVAGFAGAAIDAEFTKLQVAKGDKLLMMEAMKMQTTVYAPCDGVIAELPIQIGDTVESKDLLVKLRA